MANIRARSKYIKAENTDLFDAPSVTKVFLQSLIDSGQIDSMKQLLALVATSGNLEITRSGEDYVGLKGLDGKRFRVRFTFINNSKDVRGLIGGIYNLKAIHDQNLS